MINQKKRIDALEAEHARKEIRLTTAAGGSEKRFLEIHVVGGCGTLVFQSGGHKSERELNIPKSCFYYDKKISSEGTFLRETSKISSTSSPI